MPSAVVYILGPRSLQFFAVKTDLIARGCQKPGRSYLKKGQFLSPVENGPGG